MEATPNGQRSHRL